MTATEKKYLISRIDVMVREKSSMVREKLYNGYTPLTHKDRINLILKGKVKMLSKVKLDKASSYNLEYVKNVFDFSKFEQNKSINKLISEAQDKIQIEALRVKDTVMLGSEKEALKLLKEFTEYKV